ncbi:MAG: hypothetical protein ABI970_22040 [Chloroflexota bacterium]
MPLDPYSITPNGSINRVKLMSAAGLPEAWHGQTIYQVMGRESLVKRIGAAFPELANQADPVRIFSEQYVAQNNPAAEAIADEMGLALGCLLLVLKQGEAANRDARPEWDDSYWTQWGSIQQVILGGGLMAGVLGRHMLAKAAHMLDGLLTLEIAKYPAALPLMGTARMANESHMPNWVFDFGGTNLKRARVLDGEGKVSGLAQMPSVFMPAFSETDEIFDFMVRAIADTIVKQDWSDETVFINVSIANYVQNGRLALDTPYGRLRNLGEDSSQVFSEAVSQRAGHAVSILLVHDGTAAAKAYAGATKTAVITIGTALGWGFPPPHDSLIPIDANFHIQFVD